MLEAWFSRFTQIVQLHFWFDIRPYITVENVFSFVIAVTVVLAVNI